MRKKTPHTSVYKRGGSKAVWESTPPENREEWLARGRAAYANKYPERVALVAKARQQIEEGTVKPMTCIDCGLGGAEPEFDYVILQMIGWSHYRCRKER